MQQITYRANFLKLAAVALVACMDAITAVYQIYLASYFHAVESAAARRCTA